VKLAPALALVAHPCFEKTQEQRADIGAPEDWEGTRERGIPRLSQIRNV